MKVNNFITLFNVRTKSNQISPEDVAEQIIDLIKPKSYIPYDDKIKLVLSTIEDTKDKFPCWPHRNRLFIVNLIKTYTNLEATIQDFDVLDENRFIEPILSTFQNEYKKCIAIMDNCVVEFERCKNGQ